eukprot:3998129-Prymnesium_polylepis.2
MAFDAQLSKSAIRLGFVSSAPPHGEARPAAFLPESPAAWTEWEANNFTQFVAEAADRRPELPLISLGEFFRTAVGRPLPPVVFFAQGGQFSATAEMIRRMPRATYAWIQRMIRAGHSELIYYLELTWLYLLHPDLPEQSAEHTRALLGLRSAQSPLPFFSHLGTRGRRFLNKVWGNAEYRRKHCTF